MLPEALQEQNRRKDAILKSFKNTNADPVEGQYFTKANIKAYKSNLCRAINQGEITQDEFNKGIDAADALVEINLGDRTIYVTPGAIEKSITQHSDNLEKGKSYPIGTVHNGFKKVGEGKWRKVSSVGQFKNITKEEHLKYGNAYSQVNFHNNGTGEKQQKKHFDAASKLDDKDYTDADVLHGKEENTDLKKSIGEGSKGGRVIGHTKSGKPIYDHANHDYHRNSFSKEDHQDAIDLHNKLIKKDKGNETTHYNQIDQHETYKKNKKEQNKDLKKSFSEQEQDLLEKGGKSLPIGTVSTWSGEKWVKHSDGWVRISDKSDKHTLELPGGRRVRANPAHVEHAKAYLSGEKTASTGEDTPENKEFKEKLTKEIQKQQAAAKGSKSKSKSGYESAEEVTNRHKMNGRITGMLADDEYKLLSKDDLKLHQKYLQQESKNADGRMSESMTNTHKRRLGIVNDLLSNKDSKTIFNEKEGTLKSKDGEDLNYRVYDDGGVKIEGANVKKDFKSKAEAEKWINGENNPSKDEDPRKVLTDDKKKKIADLSSKMDKENKDKSSKKVEPLSIEDIKKEIKSLGIRGEDGNGIDIISNDKGTSIFIPTMDRGPRTDHSGRTGGGWMSDDELRREQAPYAKKYASTIEKLDNLFKKIGAYSHVKFNLDYGEKGHISIFGQLLFPKPIVKAPTGIPQTIDFDGKKFNYQRTFNDYAPPGKKPEPMHEYETDDGYYINKLDSDLKKK